MEDVFGRSEEEDMLGDPEVAHAEVTEDANCGFGFDMVAGEEEVQAEIVSEEGEGVFPGRMRPSQRMSKQERDEHERTHLLYRDWCDICVEARGRRVAHRRENKEERGQVPRVSMEHFYVSSKDEQDGNNPLVLMVDEETGDKYARMVEKKGLGSDGEIEWLVRDINEELKSWGHVGGDSGRLILKSDGEWSTKALKNALSRYLGGIIIPEVSALGESQSNGCCEQAVQVVVEFVRVLKEQVEQKAKVKLNFENNIYHWMVRWAATMCSKYMVGKDGKTLFKRRRGKKCNVVVVPFGERVLQIREGKDRWTKFETEDEEGIWWGHNRGTNEALIGTPHGLSAGSQGTIFLGQMILPRN